jgi:hypothetical protein
VVKEKFCLAVGQLRRVQREVHFILLFAGEEVGVDTRTNIVLLTNDVKLTGTAIMCFVNCFSDNTEHQVFDM